MEVEILLAEKREVTKLRWLRMRREQRENRTELTTLGSQPSTFAITFAKAKTTFSQPPQPPGVSFTTPGQSPEYHLCETTAFLSLRSIIHESNNGQHLFSHSHWVVVLCFPCNL
jgi:hypothetical protein